MKAKIYIGAKKYALYIGRKIVQKTLEFLTLPARFVSKKVQDLKNYIMYGNSVQDGTPTPETPIEVESVGDRTSNLLDTSLLEQGGLRDSDGVATSGLTRVRSSYVPVKENTLYTIYTSNVNFRNRVHCYDNNQEWIGVINIASGNKASFTTLPNTAYIRLAYQKSNTSETITPSEVQAGQTFCIEGNATASDYEPYGYKIPVTVGGTTTNIYLSEPLRKIGEYTDYIDFENKKVVRNVENYNATKLTNLLKYYGVYSTHNLWYFDIGTAEYDDKYNAISPVCNIFKGVSLIDISGQATNLKNYESRYQYSGSGSSGKTNINRIYFNYDGITDTSSMLNKLNELDFEINTIIKTPTEETIDLPAINIPQGTLIIDTDTNIKPSKMIITGDIDNE